MINEEIISYIQKQLRKNTPKDTIISKLVNAGWHMEDIDETFRKLTPPQVKINETNLPKEESLTTEVPIQKTTDQYRELPTDDKKEDIGPKLVAQSPQVSPVAKPVFSTSFSEANSQNTTASYYIPDNAMKPKTPVDSKPQELTTPINFGIMRPKLVEVPEQNTSNTVFKKPDVDTYNEEFIPKLIPKTEPNVIEPGIIETKVTASPTIPTNAILHSYQQVLSSSRDTLNIPVPSDKKKSFLKWLIIILGISVIAGAIFAFVYKNKDVNLSFIKKDPKALLVKAPQVLSSLSSYKIETEATISIPSFADITNGLVNGESINSTNRDYVSLSAKGLVNNDKTAPIFDYLATIKSSLFKDEIISNIKYGNGSTFVLTPDLKGLLGKNSPAPSTVLVDKGQFNLITSLLPDKLQYKANKINIDKLFSVGLPSYITEETASIFEEFLTNASVLEKTPEVIRGIENYHYALTADRQATKKFISKFASVFLDELSVDEKTILDEGIGSSTIDSLEIWVGKDDGNIHQYKFSLTTPLSKIIGLDDKGIAGSVVTFDWKTTYYDFNISNNIVLPGISISMVDFMKKVEDMKIKDLVSTFKTTADSLHNAIGNFGKRSNPNGSCVNPNPSSLFSPVGHVKGASNAVGNIAEVMTKILSTTGGSLSCYSTSNAWAISATLVSDSNSYFCSDSNGLEVIMEKPLSGISCK